MSTGDLAISRVPSPSGDVLAFSGRLGLRESSHAVAVVAAALASCPQRQVLCDLSLVTELASPSVLMAFPTALRRAGGWPACDLRLAAASATVAGQLQDVGMSRFLPVHRTLAEGLEAAAGEVGLDRVGLALSPEAGSIRAAREMVVALERGRRTEWSDAALVMSELATNAVRHVGRPFTVAALRLPRELVLAVTDPSRREPVVRPAEPRSRGRGLQVVERMSSRWGVRLVHSRGKTVWAAVPSPAALVPRARTALE